MNRVWTPWWVLGGLSGPTILFLNALEVPRDGPWDIGQVVKALLSLRLEDSGIVVQGMPLKDVFEELARYSAQRLPRSTSRQKAKHLLWKKEAGPNLYRALSTSDSLGDLSNLPRLAVWQASLVCGSRDWVENEEEEEQSTRASFEEISPALWALTETLEHPPTGDARTELVILAETITPVPHIESGLAKANEILTRRPELADVVNTVVRPLLLLQRYGHLVSDRIPPPPDAAALSERPRETTPLQEIALDPKPTQPDQIAEKVGTPDPQTFRETTAPRKHRPGSRTGIICSPPSRSQGPIEARVLRGSLIAPSQEILDDIARNAETIEDRVVLEDAVVTESDQAETSVLKSRAYAVRKRCAMRQGVWARGQWDALTPSEMRHIQVQLWEKWQTYRDDSQSSMREAAALAMLCAGTGFSSSRAYCLRTEGSESVDENDDWVRPKNGLLSMPLPATDPRYTPSNEQQSYLVPVGDRIEICLPRELSDIVAHLPPAPEGYLFAAPLEELLEHIRGWLASERDSEPRFTLARMHRAHRLEVLVQSGDVGLSQFVCGDPLGVATTPTSYYAARSSDIQAAYSNAIQRHGFTPSLSPGSSERTGSRLMLTAESVASVTSSVCRRLTQSPKASRTEGRHAIKLHSEIVPSLALMVMAATTFRPTFRLGELTSAALCLPTSIAVITDKVSDEQHFARLVPLCPLLKSSIAAYGQHLERLAKNETITADQRAAATGALAGTSPLLFLFDRAGVRPLDLEALDSRLPDGWILPRNFLRHRTATALREAGCPGSYVQALLGHLEAGLQPFGEESFMDPQHYIRITSNYLDKMLKADGWRALVGGSNDLHVFERHRPPLAADVSQTARRIEKNLERRFREQRKQVVELRKVSGTTIAQAVDMIISEALPDLVQSPSTAHVITSEQVSLLADLVCREAEGTAEVELRVAALRDYLTRGRKEHAWKVKRLPRFHVFRPTPSVFHTDFVRGYAAIDHLRTLFAKELAESKAKPDGDRCVRQLILALILWHGVSDASRLLGILSGIGLAQRVHGLSDAIVVPIFLPDPNKGAPKESSEVLRGAVALAAVGARQYIPDTITVSDIQTIVSDWVAKRVYADAPTKTLDALLAAAAITHRFESPPPLRAVWTGEVTSVSISAARVISLMHGDDARTTNELVPARLDLEPPTSTRSNAIGKKREDYDWLKATIRYEKGKIKTFPNDAKPSNETDLRNQPKRVNAKRQTDSDIREETIERLDMRLAAWPEDYSFMRAFTSYAYNRLRFGTPWNSYIQQDSLYTYLLAAATHIFAQDPEKNIRNMDAEDFHDLYQDILETISARYNAKLSTYLSYFHSFLVANNHAPSVAIGKQGRNGRCFPDVGYVTPTEITNAVELLKQTVLSAQDSRGSTSDLEAAIAGMVLGFAAGARTSETLLREVRELIVIEGRRALLIRRNPYVRVKTKRGTRLVGLEETMPANGWNELLRWLDDTKSFRVRADGDRTALLLDAETMRPIDTARLTRWITPTLREVTGASDARPYWWRHTSASNEFLALHADNDLLTEMRAAVPLSAHGWLPTQDAIVKAIGSQVPMGQAHAAEYRSRRGHSRMSTSLETYIHVAALIQPPGSRNRAAELSSTSLGVLSGLAPATGRQRLSRADIPSSSVKASVSCLLDTWTDIPEVKVDDSVTGKPSDTLRTATRKIANVTVGKAILRGLRTGELGLVSNSLHLTQTEIAKWQTDLFEAANSNIYGIRLPGLSSVAPSDISSAPRATVRQKRVVQPSRVDESWILDCVERANKNPDLFMAWDIALRGVDSQSGCIAVNTDAEFVSLAKHLPIAINAEGQTSKYVCSTVVIAEDGADHLSAAQSWIADRSISLSISIASDFSPPAGWSGLGFQVTRRSNGKRVRHSVLLAALLVRCLRAM